MARKDLKYTVEIVKKGKRTYGEIRRLPDGRSCYVAYRKHSEIFRGGKHRTISEALKDGSASWAFDEETILMLRARGVPFVGVMVRENGDLFMTRMDHIMDRTKVKIMNYSGRGGALQRYLPLRWFVHRTGSISL